MPRCCRAKSRDHRHVPPVPGELLPQGTFFGSCCTFCRASTCEQVEHAGGRKLGRPAKGALQKRTLHRRPTWVKCVYPDRPPAQFRCAETTATNARNEHQKRTRAERRQRWKKAS